MKIIKLLLIAALFIVCFSFSVQSAQVTIPVTNGATIDSTSSDAGRLLFKFALPQELDGACIDYAELLFEVKPEPSSTRRIVIGGFALNKDWDARSISWTEPWTSDGGDYIDTLMATCLNSKEEKRLTSLDITEIVRLWVEEKVSNFGLILMDSDRENGKLKLQQSSILPEGVKAQVRVFYTAGAVNK